MVLPEIPPSPLERRLLAGFALALLLLFAMAATAAYSALSFRSAGRQVLETDEILNHLERLLGHLTAVQSGSRGYIISGEERFLSSYEAGKRGAGQELPALVRMLSADPAQRERSARLQTMIEAQLEEVEIGVSLGRSGDAAAAEEHVASGRGKALLDGIRDLLAEIRTGQEALREERLAAARVTGLSAAWTMATGLAFAFVLLGAVFVVGRRHLRERERANLLVEQARQYSDNIVDTVHEALLILSSDLRVHRANRAFYVTFAARPEDTVGRMFSELQEGRWNIPALLEKLATIVPDHAELQDFEATLNLPGLGTRVMRLNARKLFRPGNNTELLLLAIEDITHRHRAEAEIRRLNEGLRQRAALLEAANQELEAFSYSVSHDLRAPLRHIDGFAQLLKKRVGDTLDPVASRHLETITVSAQKLGVLIDELLQFSRTGRAELSRRHTDMHALVNEVIRELRNESAARQIDWRVDELPAVDADPSLVRQVWRNLLANAVKYTRQRDAAVISVSHRQDAADGHVFSVRDNGAGFDMKYANKLFGVFQRLHSEREFEGTGVGLANVRRIVQRHGGRTWAEGSPGEGAVFHFSLPNQTGAEIAALTATTS